MSACRHCGAACGAPGCCDAHCARAARRHALAVWIGALAMVLLGLLGALGALGAEAPPRPNLLLVTLDTVRADRLGCYGDRKAATPRLDRLAAEGAAFDTAIAPAPLTLPSHATLLTGRYPPAHGVRDNADFRLPAGSATLATHLAAQGYRTAAAVGSVVLAASEGLAQGFATYDEPRDRPATGGEAIRYKPIVERRAADVTRAATAALDRLAGGPFFLWVHYYDAHAPYDPPAPYATRFAADPYAGEIASVDEQLGRLLDALAAKKLLDRTLVVVVADHGEGLGDHGELTHGILLYDATLRVPLLMRLPGAIPAGRRVAELVSLADLAPTVLDLLGQPPLPHAQGRSAATSLRAKAPAAARAPAYAEAIVPQRTHGWAPLFALRGTDFAYIDAPAPELYDLARDPREMHDLARERAAEAARRAGELAQLRASIGDAAAVAAQAPSDEERRNRLAGLGYVSGGAATLDAARGADPKAMIAVANDVSIALDAVAAGKPAAARTAIERALARDPANPAALALAGGLDATAGKKDAGIARLERAARAAPGVYTVQRNLAAAYAIAGRRTEAIAALRAAIAIRPDGCEDHYALGRALSGTSAPPAEAIAAFRRAIELGCTTPQAYAGLGSALAAAGQHADAEAALRQAIAAGPALAGPRVTLAQWRDRAGRRDEALALLDEALAAQPLDADALFERGRLLLLTGATERAARDVETLRREHPAHDAGLFLLAHLRRARGDDAGARAALDELTARKDVDPRLSAAAARLRAELQ